MQQHGRERLSQTKDIDAAQAQHEVPLHRENNTGTDTADKVEKGKEEDLGEPLPDETAYRGSLYHTHERIRCIEKSAGCLLASIFLGLSGYILGLGLCTFLLQGGLGLLRSHLGCSMEYLELVDHEHRHGGGLRTGIRALDHGGDVGVGRCAPTDPGQ